MDTEKKPQRPRIGATSIPGNSEPQRYEKVNYPDNAERKPSDNTAEGGYQPRPYQQRPYQQAYQQRRPGNYQPKNYGQPSDETQQNGEEEQSQPYSNYRPRYGNRQQGGYYRQPGGYNNNRQGGYNNRQNAYGNNRSGGYNNNQGDYYSNNRSGYNNHRGDYNGDRQNGYNNNRQQNGYYQQSGGYNNNRQGGYNNNRPGGYGNRPGGYNNNRQGGYNNNRQGGYNNNRPGGYNHQQGNRNGFPQQRAQRFTPRPKQVEYTIDIPDPDSEMRLNKYMSNAGICSRREADEKILAGLVKVNGVAVTELGAKIKPADVVEYEDKIVVPERKCYVLLNKPKDCVTTSDDPGGRTTVLDIVKNACRERIYPVGRLDRNTTGVLLLTNDGDLASKLTHPKYVKKKIYHVWADKPIEEEDMQRIADGIELEDGEIHADEISYVSDTDKKQAGIEIHSGRNRIVRRIFEALGYRVMKLDRVYFAGLTKKNLPRGKWRYLSQEEVNYLRRGSFE